MLEFTHEEGHKLWLNPRFIIGVVIVRKASGDVIPGLTAIMVDGAQSTVRVRGDIEAIQREIAKALRNR